jgi:hypothetical protein
MILLTDKQTGAKAMRKIQVEILEAIRAKQSFSSGSDAVVVSDTGNIQIILHGSPIVRVENNAQDIFVSLAEWNTPTTRGRINVALHYYGVSLIGNRSHKAYIANVEIPSAGWVQVMRAGVEIPAEVQN